MGNETVTIACPECQHRFAVRGLRPVVSCPKCGRNVSLAVVPGPTYAPARKRAYVREPADAHKAIFQCLACGLTYEWVKGQTSVPTCPTCDSTKSVARSPIAAVVAEVAMDRTKVRVLKLLRSSFQQLTEVRRKIQELRKSLDLVGFPTPDLEGILRELSPQLDNVDQKVEAFLNARFNERLEKMGLSRDEDRIKAWIHSGS